MTKLLKKVKFLPLAALLALIAIFQFTGSVEEMFSPTILMKGFYYGYSTPQEVEMSWDEMILDGGQVIWHVGQQHTTHTFMVWSIAEFVAMIAAAVGAVIIALWTLKRALGKRTMIIIAVVVGVYFSYQYYNWFWYNFQSAFPATLTSEGDTVASATRHGQVMYVSKDLLGSLVPQFSGSYAATYIGDQNGYEFVLAGQQGFFLLFVVAELFGLLGFAGLIAALVVWGCEWYVARDFEWGSPWWPLLWLLDSFTDLLHRLVSR